MKDGRYQILLTNDDGILSPGLWAAANALSKLGFVTIAAPREQQSGAGRSLPGSSDGKVELRTLQIGEQTWQAYAVGGSPAQTVLHAVLEVMDSRPDLVVSGINYGENIGNSVTISGTVGAAMEAASMGIPALAASVQLQSMNYHDYDQIDFSTAAHFTQLFAQQLLTKKMPDDVDLLKVEVPSNATPQTPWKVARLSRYRYFAPIIERSGALHETGRVSCYLDAPAEIAAEGSDISALIFDHMVAVTPISLDMTSRVSLADLENYLRQE